MKGVGRWATAVAMVAAAFAGGAFMQWLVLGNSVAQAASAKQATKEVRAQAFVLVDATGRECARLGPGREPQGNSTIDYPGLRFFDRKGVRRLTIGAAADGTGAGMGLYYADGKLAIGLGAGPEGTGITLRDAQGRERAGIGMPPWAGVSFVTMDENGRATWRAPEPVGR